MGLGDVYKRQRWGAASASVVTVERWRTLADAAHQRLRSLGYGMGGTIFGDGYDCLLYTSEAGGERSRVDLGGRRILKKKKPTVYQPSAVVMSQQQAGKH